MKRATSIDELTEEVMHCRAFGHQWHDHGATRVGKGMARGWRVTMICTCCGTLKLFDLGRNGHLEHPRYIYSDGYLARFFVGREERAAMRLGALRDLLERAGDLQSVKEAS